MSKTYKRWYDAQRKIMAKISVEWLEDILAWRKSLGSKESFLRPIIDEISDKKAIDDKLHDNDNKIDENGN